MGEVAFSSAAARPCRRALVLGLLTAELVAIAALFQFGVSFDCRAAGAYGACMAVRNSIGRGIALLAVVAIVPALRTGLLGLPPRTRAMPWPVVHAAGIALILAPALLPDTDDFARTFRMSLPLWGAGASLATLGALLWIAAPADWRRLARPACLVPVAAALAAPELLGLADRLWRGAALPDLTFALVARGLAPFGSAEVFPAERIVMLDDFAVEVAGPCSGMEGVALITALLGLHLWLHRASLRWPVTLVLVPLAIAASLALNVLRIGALVLIGARISPVLAVDGFHSHAGWLAFTLLAFGLIALTRLSCFHAGSVTTGPDETAALILPFVATMLVALALDTFAADPEIFYPARAAVMLAALLPFVAAWVRLGRPSLWSIAVGAAVGIAWLATAPDASTQGSGGIWLAVRIAGAVLLTPVVEESFFRGYLQPRLIRAGLPASAAVCAAAALFGLLHGRWLAGTAAGIVFGAVALRRGRLVEAIAAHAAANAVLAIAGAA